MPWVGAHQLFLAKEWKLMGFFCAKILSFKNPSSRIYAVINILYSLLAQGEKYAWYS